MDGGKFRINRRNVDSFWKKYLSALKSEKTMCLVERANATRMRFFMDIDIKHAPDFDMEDFILRVATLYPDGDYVVCVREDCGKLEGVHVIFHNVTYETTEECMDIYKKFEWVDGIDESVYNTGLRVIGSTKPGQTFESKHMYLPKYRVRGCCAQRIPQTISLKNIQDTTIRLSHENRVMNFMKTCEVCDVDIPETKNIHKLYENSVVSVTEYKNGYYVAKSNSKFCTNIGKEHSSAHVYFVIHPESRTMYQKCFCKCDDKTCKDYKSKSVTISKETCDLVLGHQPA
jgi:hypothetical protein